MPESSVINSSLTHRLRARVLRDGPIPFRDWMAAALYDKEDGYYTRNDKQPWGRQGDYRTSPERSELFAATFARYFAGLYNKLGQPPKWTIMEAGAGDGSFAHGVLSTLRDFFPQVFSSTHYVVDEVGAPEFARRRLEPFADRVEFRPLSESEIKPGVVFSNELLDAFPVHRVTVQNGELREFYVGVGDDESFVWTLRAPSSERLVDHLESHHIHLAEGQTVEVNLAIEDWVQAVAAKLTRGYLVHIDYGAEAQDLYSSSRIDGTLRGFRGHRFADDLLANPGEQDLTSTVNWTLVRAVGESVGLMTVAYERQDKFLLSAGLLTQLHSESERAADDAERLRLSTAAREMILPNGMATSFQVLVQEKGETIHEL